ncbi:hypothetical protein [Streptomyces fagopyri]|uniref:hypothetical protein n=1 Tax=Streptomyces fagopyri TaxID=2662397 RepID=UPI0033CD766A
MSEGHVTAPCRVSFDRERTPPHRLPDEPTATHVIDVPHLLLSAGERRFVKVPKERLALIGDPELLRGRAPMTLRPWAWGAVRPPRHGPRLSGRARSSLTAHNRAVSKGQLSARKEPGAAVPRSPRRSYHPSQEGSPRRAVECPERSPAARTAAGVLGRAAVS